MTRCPSCGQPVAAVPLEALLALFGGECSREMIRVLAAAGEGVAVPRSRILAATHGGRFDCHAEGSLSGIRVHVNRRLAAVGWRIAATPSGTRDPQWRLEQIGE